jgi:hypothetical protein
MSQVDQQQVDLQETVSDNRLLGLWRMMLGYRTVYLGAVIALALAATLKTASYYLLAYLVDDVLAV